MAWLRSEYQFIAERNAFLASEDRQHFNIIDESNRFVVVRAMNQQDIETLNRGFPFWRRWMGDRRVNFIDLRLGCPTDVGDRASRLFPEAVVIQESY